MAKSSKANIVAVMGGSGSGKSTYIKREIERTKPKRLIIFDVMHEYHSLGDVVTTCSGLVSQIKKKSFAVVFFASSKNIQEQFDFVCKVAFAAGDLTLVVEELNRVTQPNRAPPHWQDCTSRGRHKGMSIYGASQRPAGVDKDFFSNATKIRTGRLNFDADIKTLANVLNVGRPDISNLKPLEYLERDMSGGDVVSGVLRF